MSKPQVMTLKDATTQGLVGAPHRQVVSQVARRAIASSTKPNAKGICACETVPDVLDGMKRRSIRLGGSTSVVVYDTSAADAVRSTLLAEQEHYEHRSAEEEFFSSVDAACAARQ
jgi:hypothetical protein